MFAKSFGYMNIIGVLIQLIFPCSPPWYENLYGLAPANYSIHGSPAGLARIDELFGIALYTPGFTSSPMVFGAFPSMHAGSATIEALFMGHVFPRLKPLFIAYTLWLWWATMYLSHHYAVDLVGGSLSRYIFFESFKLHQLICYQLPASSSTSQRLDFFPANSQTRHFAGITIMPSLAKNIQKKAMRWQIYILVISMQTNGQSALPPRFPLDPSVLEVTRKVSPCGKERH